MDSSKTWRQEGECAKGNPCINKFRKMILSPLKISILVIKSGIGASTWSSIYLPARVSTRLKRAINILTF